MKFSHVVAGAAATVLTVSLLVGCSPSSTTSPSGAASAGGGSTDGVVSVWYLSDNTMVEDAVKRFEAEHPEVELKATSIANDQYKTKIRVALGTPSGPDVFFTWSGANLNEYARSGLAASIDDLAARDGFKEVFSDSILAQGKVDGVQYAVPLSVDGSAVWYNKEIFSKVGVEPPTTWDQFLDLIAKVKDAGYIPIATANKTQWPGAHWWSEMVTLACGPEFQARVVDKSPDVAFTDPCVVEAHKRIQDLVKAGAFNDGFNGLDYDNGESRQLFWSGKSAMLHMGNWIVTSAQAEAPELVDKLDFFTVPAWDGAKGTSDMMTAAVGVLYAMSKTAKDPAAAQLFLSYLADGTTAQDTADGGRIPVREGATIPLPVVKEFSETLNKSSFLTPWPDQMLEPELSTEMLTQSQAVFGLEATPEAAAEALQTVYAKVSGQA